MLDSRRLALVGGVAALVALAYADPDLVVLGLLGFTAAYAYAGYWGLAIRRGLLVRDYRNQALGASFPALYAVLVSAVTGATNVSANSSTTVILINGLVDYGWFFVIFYWVANAVSAARRSDPLERDSLRFRAVRHLWLICLLIAGVIALAYNPIALVFTVAAPLDPLSIALALAPPVVLIPFGALLLYVSGTRSGDRVLKRHIRWFGIAIASFFVAGLPGTIWRTTGGNASPYALVIDPVFLGGEFLAAYCFYRSAKSLVPLSRTL